MRIANTIPGYGMACSNDLKQNIADLIKEHTITKVIETGTYFGLGTTKAVLEGFKSHGMEYDFVSIEVNPEHHAQAKANNIGTDVKFVLGRSIPKSLEPVSFSWDVPYDIIVDHSEKDRERNYRMETNYNVPDAVLSIAKDMKPELVILDSAGYMGLIEFKYLMSLLPDHSFFLVLDDTGHVKHYDTLQLIKSMPGKFQIYWESEQTELHRSAIIRVHEN